MWGLGGHLFLDEHIALKRTFVSVICRLWNIVCLHTEAGGSAVAPRV